MKTKFTAFLLSAALIFSCFSLVGCTSKKNSASVYFLNFKPESAAVYEELASKYEAETGVKVKVVTAAANTYEQTLKSEIAKSEPPTIFQVNGPIGYKNWEDYCLNLEKSQLYSLLSDPDYMFAYGKFPTTTAIYDLPQQKIFCKGENLFEIVLK